MITFCRNCGDGSEYTDPKKRPNFCKKCGEKGGGVKAVAEHRPPETPSIAPPESTDRPVVVKAVAAAPVKAAEPPRPRKWSIRITSRDEEGDWKTAEIEAI